MNNEPDFPGEPVIISIALSVPFLEWFSLQVHSPFSLGKDICIPLTDSEHRSSNHGTSATVHHTPDIHYTRALYILSNS